MSDPHGIIIFGANGSGKTTLGRELARILNLKHMDIEDYCFDESDIPYTKPRPRDMWINLMLVDIEKYRSFVISTVIGDLGDTIPRYYQLAIHLSAPLFMRMERVKRRSLERYGDRVLQGGDMYEQELQFFDFVSSRPLSRIDEWAQTLTCPVIHADGTENYKKNAINIAKLYNKLRFEWEAAK
jgi:adenylate kinase family enzyme